MICSVGVLRYWRAIAQLMLEFYLDPVLTAVLCVAVLEYAAHSG